jgi:hypothetical protein
VCPAGEVLLPPAEEAVVPPAALEPCALPQVLLLLVEEAVVSLVPLNLDTQQVLLALMQCRWRHPLNLLRLALEVRAVCEGGFIGGALLNLCTLL